MLKKILAIALLLFCFGKSGFAGTSRNLTIFAEPNMVIALTKIARFYSQKNNVILSLNFASSSNLIADIDTGEPIDIFISAHSTLIESLRHKGLVDVYNIGYFAEDELVLAVSKNNKSNLILPEQNLTLESVLAILNRNKSSLIIDDEGSSSGKFSSDFIEKHKFADLRVIQRLNEDKNLIADLVSSSDHYGLLLKSQVDEKENLQILVSKKDENIFYQALVIAGDNMENAREFLKFLKGSVAKDILQKSGFRAE